MFRSQFHPRGTFSATTPTTTGQSLVFFFEIKRPANPSSAGGAFQWSGEGGGQRTSGSVVQSMGVSVRGGRRGSNT